MPTAMCNAQHLHCTVPAEDAYCLDCHQFRATPTRINGLKDALPLAATVRPFMRVSFMFMMVMMVVMMMLILCGPEVRSWGWPGTGSMRYNWGTVGSQSGHSWVTVGSQLGHSEP